MARGIISPFSSLQFPQYSFQNPLDSFDGSNFDSLVHAVYLVHIWTDCYRVYSFSKTGNHHSTFQSRVDGDHSGFFFENFISLFFCDLKKGRFRIILPPKISSIWCDLIALFQKIGFRILKKTRKFGIHAGSCQIDNL